VRYIDKQKQHLLNLWHGIDQSITDIATDEWRGHLQGCLWAVMNSINMHLAVSIALLFYVVCVMFFVSFVICNKLGLLTSEGSAATYLKYGTNFYVGFIANFIHFSIV